MPNNNKYIINNETLCAYGKNNIPNDEHISCKIDSHDISYINMNDLIINNTQNVFDKYNGRQKKVEAIYRLIRDEIIMYNWSGNCIPVNIIFNEILHQKNIQSELKSGYLLMDYDKFASWHCWTTVDNQQYDLARDILKVLVPECANMCKTSKITLSNSVPGGYTRIDKDNDNERNTLKLNIELMNLYKSDPENFWNTVVKIKKFSKTGNVSFSDVKKIRDRIHSIFAQNVPENNNISIEDALKVWIGTAKYNDNDYKIFLEMKKMNCANIFLSWCIPGGGGLLGGHEYVNLENETVDKKYLYSILEKKFRPHVKQVRKIKHINEDDADFIVPYDDNMNMISVTVCKD